MDQDKSDTIGLPDLYLGSSTDQYESDTIGLPDLYLGSDMDQDKPDTTRLTHLYLGSQHEQDVTDQLQRYNKANRPVSRTTVCSRSPNDQEHPEDQYRPMTPGEEEIMGIYADGIYCSPDIIEKSGGFWVTSTPVLGELLQTVSFPTTNYSSF